MNQLLMRTRSFVKTVHTAVDQIETSLLRELPPVKPLTVEELADLLTQFLIIDSQAKAARELITEYMRSKIRQEVEDSKAVLGRAVK